MTFQPESTLIEFVHYNHWANQQLFTICSNLNNERLLTENILGTKGSILETFSHILRAETSFLQRIHKTSPQPNFDWEAPPNLSQMATFEHEIYELFLETVQQIPPTHKVHEESDTWSFDYQARLIFMSLVYHGVSHRTDVMTFLNNNGIELPELDVWGYQEAYPDRFQAKIVKKS